jgi:DNA-binding transcriptional MerR regulator
MNNLGLSELCERAGVTQRTVRYYIQQGLLPMPGAGRDSRKYDAAYLDRLQLIRRMQREHLPLAEIRQRLTGLSDSKVASMLSESRTDTGSAKAYLAAILGSSAPSVAEEPGMTANRSFASPHSSYPRDREQWDRMRLADDVELHVRRPVTRDMNRRLERLLEAARQILHDDP